MHIFFSGIGGAGIGPLALIAKQAGYTVSGSDKQESGYTANLRSKGITSIHIGQTRDSIESVHKKTPIDWIVYSSAVIKENPHHPELQFAHDNNIRHSKRDDFLQKLLDDTAQRMIAVAGTHGKTTTTAMLIWLFKELDEPISYSVGGKLSFGGIGEFDPDAQYFVYEADEYDRNFLSFHPVISAIPGIAYDHPDIYPTRESYNEAFAIFVSQSQQAVLWADDAVKINVSQLDSVTSLVADIDISHIKLAGTVNRHNAHLACVTVEKLGLASYKQAVEIINQFPGVSRRFEKIADNIYTDYAHTPEKILGALDLVHELAGENVVVVYEGLHNTRQHFIREQLKTLFAGIYKLYIVPSYRAREDESLEDLTPEKLCALMTEPSNREPASLNEELKNYITKHVKDGMLVLCLTAGGGGSLDEWLRTEFKS